jgi:hypothetical protein
MFFVFVDTIATLARTSGRLPEVELCFIFFIIEKSTFAVVQLFNVGVPGVSRVLLAKHSSGIFQSFLEGGKQFLHHRRAVVNRSDQRPLGVANNKEAATISHNRKQK